MNKKYIGILIAFSSVFYTQAQQVVETSAVTVTAQQGAAGTPPVRGVVHAEMKTEEVRKVQLTGNAEVDAKVKSLLEEEKIKIKAIREEYSVKIKAVIGERVAEIRASSTKATSTKAGVPKMIERIMDRKATTTGMVRGTSSKMMIDGAVEDQGNGAGLRLRALFRGFFGGAEAQ